MRATLFCTAGRHDGPVMEMTKPKELLSGWRLIRASFIDGIWVYDPYSSTAIIVCPDCYLWGEPSSN